MADKDDFGSGSPAAVAFKLMQQIHNFTEPTPKADKKYWLTLYTQCLHATSGHTLQTSLKEE